MPRTADEFVEVTISTDGTIESEVHGVLGPDCSALVDWMEDLGQVIEHRRTPDYNRRQRRATRATLRR